MRRVKGPRMFPVAKAVKLLGVQFSAATLQDNEPCTERQAAALRRFGIKDAEDVSFAKAGKLMDAFGRHIEGGLSTLRQVAWLVEHNIDVDTVRATTFADASDLISEMKSR